MKRSLFSIRQITVIAILAAISAILLIFNFQLLSFPVFYKFDFSDLPCLLCGFSLGPLSGVTCVIISRLLNIILEAGSETGYIGEFASLIIGASFVLTSSVVYKRKHSKKGAIYSLILGVLISSIVATLVNYFVLLPLFVPNMFADVNEKILFVLMYTLPFNVVKGAINSLIIIFIYKRISPLIKGNNS